MYIYCTVFRLKKPICIHITDVYQSNLTLQENIDCSYESVASSPDPVVSVFDRAAQGVVCT